MVPNLKFRTNTSAVAEPGGAFDRWVCNGPGPDWRMRPLHRL